MRGVAWFLLLAVGACSCGDGGQYRKASDPGVPASDEEFVSLPPGAPFDDVLRAVEEGLATPGKGPDHTRFVVIRAADRHPPEVRDESFHVLVGADVRMPAGTLRIRRQWATAGEIDGTNEEPQRMGIAVAVERQAPRPFPPEVVRAVRDVCEALRRRAPLHPACILAMEEIPYTNHHEADPEERALAEAARAEMPPPAPDGTLTVVSGERRLDVAYERRDTRNAINVGMMFRKAFDGENRGMLFVYKQRNYRHFWMRNVFIPIDVAYIADNGRIEQIETMAPAAGQPQSQIRTYDSDAAVRLALEMPGGWFARNGVGVGDLVLLE